MRLKRDEMVHTGQTSYAGGSEATEHRRTALQPHLFYSPRTPLHNVTAQQSSESVASFLKQPFWWCLATGVFAATLAIFSSGESLWLDELHTSWTVSANLAEVAERAQQGNQSPLYFWVLFGFKRTLGLLNVLSAETLLRLPSALSWGASVTLCLVWCWQLLNYRREWLLLVVCGWFVLDRNQLFYATEARGYALVQLLCLLAWISIGKIACAPANSTGPAWDRGWILSPIAMWCLLSVHMLFLHITSLLAIVWQAAAGTWYVWRKGSKGQRRFWSWALVLVALAIVLALGLNRSVWEHRSQWKSFAGDASLSHVLSMFPVLALGIPVCVARLLDSWWGKKPLLSPVNMNLWWLAGLGPWSLAWLVTAMDLAPMFHRRFVIVSAIPLVMLAFSELNKVGRPALRVAAALGVCGWLLISQGTLDNWRQGQLVGWQRVEGWREATAHVNKQWQPADRLWCASGLIEGDNAALPLSPSLNRYLSFPLRGDYRVCDSSGGFVEPNSLIGDWEVWWQQLSQAKVGRVWIVSRGNPAAFLGKMQQLQRIANENGVPWQIAQLQAFGTVSVCCMEPAAS